MAELADITPGLSATVRHQVDESSTASHKFSGSVDVLATPELVRLMEQAAVTALVDRLPPGATTVGAVINVQHLAPTPVGLGVEVTATLTGVEGHRLTFDIVARDDVEEIGRATHERVVVDEEKFMAGAKQKLTDQAPNP
jgi:predicted thioesterase